MSLQLRKVWTSHVIHTKSDVNAEKFSSENIPCSVLNIALGKLEQGKMIFLNFLEICIQYNFSFVIASCDRENLHATS
jgi:hypothetical protein